MTRHDTNLSFTRSDNTWAVRTDHTNTSFIKLNPLPADTAWVLESKRQEKGEEKAGQEAQKCFNLDAFTQMGESRDLYINRVYPDYNALGPRFAELAEAFYRPLAEALQQGDGESDDE